MVDTCAYRAAGTEAAAQALYEYYAESSMVDRSIFPPWENTTEPGKEYWRKMFRAGHKAYRDTVKEEG